MDVNIGHETKEGILRVKRCFKRRLQDNNRTNMIRKWKEEWEDGDQLRNRGRDLRTEARG